MDTRTRSLSAGRPCTKGGGAPHRYLCRRYRSDPPKRSRSEATPACLAPGGREGGRKDLDGGSISLGAGIDASIDVFGGWVEKKPFDPLGTEACGFHRYLDENVSMDRSRSADGHRDLRRERERRGGRATNAAMATCTRVYLDVAVAKRSLGRIVVVLRDDVVPKTCENFRKLCVGGPEASATYRGTRFHRIIPGFMCQGGDYERGDGTGGQSAFGGKFQDENFVLRHERAGVLSMANAGPNTNGSQFFITTVATPWLDGKHVVFGHVESGMEVVRAMEGLGNADGKPKKRVHIVDCGVLEAENVKAITKGDEGIKETQQERAETLGKIGERRDGDAAAQDDGIQSEMVGKDTEEAQDVDLESMNPRQRKFFELRLKLNQARNLNSKAVIAEKQRSENPGREQAEQKRKVSVTRASILPWTGECVCVC